MIAAVYRLLLGAFPRRHRDLYAAEMIDAFERELELRRAAGRVAALRFAAAACANAIGSGVAERRRRHVLRAGYFFSVLDFTLAWRMLLRYPGLTIVSVFGMAVGIAVAGAAFAIVSMLMDPRLPLPGGDRIVSVTTIDTATRNTEMRMLRDYDQWRSLTSIEDLGIVRVVSRNLIVAGHPSEPVIAAEMTASAFRVAGIAAARGRFLLPEDEAAGAEPAMVIGYDEWVRRFGGDQDIIGRRVQLGADSYKIVGVMPDGFGFPVNNTIWIPWRLDPLAYPPRTGPRVAIFGRLAPAATIETAQAELTELGRRAAQALPSTHQHLRSRVMPYVFAYTDMGEPENFLAMRAIQMAMALLLIVVSVNVAILVYARTATRQGEIVVRAALGASRLRIIAQLLVEAVTLAGIAAAIGLGVLVVAMPHMQAAFLSIVGGRLPFWMEFRLKPDAVIYVIALTLLAAVIVGVLPAIKATRRTVQAGLQSLSPGSGSRMQMGRLWTLLIVAQVALTVALMPAALFFTWDGLRLRSGDNGFASGEFVNASLDFDRSSEPPTAAGEAAFAARYAAVLGELERRLRGEPQVADVTFSIADAGGELAMVLQGEHQPLPLDPAHYNIVEGSQSGHLARYNRVAVNFFDAFKVPVLLGRSLTSGDVAAGHVVINRTLAGKVFGTSSPLGARIKYVGRSREATEDAASPAMEKWYEVVGVVADFPAQALQPEPRVYHAAELTSLYPARVGVRVRSGDPAAFFAALRETTTAVHPNLQLRNVTTIESVVRSEQAVFRMIGATVGMVMLSVIVLSAAGIYALMSFTVAKRRREIGIRAALGADRHRLLAGVFSRVLMQLGAGAAAGMLGAVMLEQVLEGEMFQGRGAVILPIVAIVMTIVGLLAAIGPARQGLSIQPVEALREE